MRRLQGACLGVLCGVAPLLLSPANGLEDDVPLDIDKQSPKCKKEIKDWCAEVEHGSGSLARCLRGSSWAMNVAFANTKVISEDCHEIVVEFFRNMSNLTVVPGKGFKVEPVTGMNEGCKGLIEAELKDNGCMHTIDKIVKYRFKHHSGGLNSSQSPLTVLRGGDLLTCLFRDKRKTTVKCRELIVEAQTKESADVRYDVHLHKVCHGDLLTKCRPRLADGEGLVCLEEIEQDPSHSGSVSSDCKEAVFVKEEEISEDIRFSARVFKRCQAEMKEFCQYEEEGEGRVLGCLQDNIWKSRFGDECRSEVLRVSKRMNSDYHLNYRIRTKCDTDIRRHCSKAQKAADQMTIQELYGTGTKDNSGMSGQVLQCLKEKFLKATTTFEDGCTDEVKSLIRFQAENPETDKIFLQNCSADVDKFCRKVSMKGVESIHVCLRGHFQKISPACQSVEVLLAALESKVVWLKPQVKADCSKELANQCKKADKAEAQECLHNAVINGEDFLTGACKQTIEEEIEVNNKDYKLKYGISKHCAEDRDKVKCSGTAGINGSAAMDCLKDHFKELSRGCRIEVQQYIREVSADPKASALLWASCQDDAKKHCQDVPEQNGMMHECLMRSYAKLKPECKAKELQQQMLMSEDVRLKGSKYKACKSTISKLCGHVNLDQHGAVWKCLENNYYNQEMKTKCRKAVQEQIALKHKFVQLNPNLKEVCAKDAEQLCNQNLEDDSGKKNKDPLDCLLMHRQQVHNPDCSKSLMAKALQRLDDIRNNPGMRDVCKEEVQEFCQTELTHAEADGDVGGVQSCLEEHRKELSEECSAKVFKNMKMKSTDVRLNRKMYSLCRPAIDRFCKDTPYGQQGQIIQCLLSHKDDEEMPQIAPGCQGLLGVETVKRSENVVFNPLLKAACDASLGFLIEEKEDCPSLGNITCLVKYRDRITDSSCESQLQTLLIMQTEDIRAVPNMAENCKEDIEQLCSKAKAGGGKLQSCLAKHLSKIKNQDCQDNVEDLVKIKMEDAMYNPAVRKYCMEEMKTHCKDVQNGDGRLFQCLGLNMDEVDFSGQCKAILNRLKTSSAELKEASELSFGKGLVEDMKVLVTKKKDALGGWHIVLITFVVALSAIVLALVGSFSILKAVKGGYTVVVPRDLNS